MRGAESKCRVVKMHLTLWYQQLNTHIHIPIYLMVTTNQKSIIDIHTKRKRNPNITLKTVITSQDKRTKEEERKK